MAEFAALPLFTDSWIADTAHLSRAERGLYHDLLVLMWRTPECRVPNEIDWIMRKLRCSEDERAMLVSVLDEFTTCDGNWRTQKRLKKEFEYVRANSRKQSVRAKSRWKKEKPVSRGNAAPHGPGNAPTPSPSPSIVELSSSAREPLAVLETKLRDAAGWQSHPSPHLFVTGPIDALLKAGCDLEMDVLAVIRRDAPRCHHPTWKFFIPAIIQARDDRIGAANVVPPQPQPKPAGYFNGTHQQKPSRRNNLAMVDAAIEELRRREADGSA